MTEVKSRDTGRKIISFTHMPLDGFVMGPNGEMNWIKVDEEIFHHVGKRMSEGDTVFMWVLVRRGLAPQPVQHT